MHFLKAEELQIMRNPLGWVTNLEQPVENEVVFPKLHIAGKYVPCPPKLNNSRKTIAQQ